jgi:hypothetical protein
MTGKRLITRPLTAETAAQAFPLIREVSGSGTLAEWLHFAHERLESGEQTGVIVCERGPYIRGLFGWEMEKGVGGQRKLVVQHFSVPGAWPPGDVIEALLDAIDTLALQLGCREIHVEMPISSQLHPAFAKHGLLPGSVGLYRKVSGTHASSIKPDA